MVATVLQPNQAIIRIGIYDVHVYYVDLVQ